MFETRTRDILTFKETPHLLVVEARYYADICDHLFDGAKRVMDTCGATYDRVVVPGALEAPAAVAIAEQAKMIGTMERPYDGYIVLGCVIRGATTHYETVAGESARGLMNVSTEYGAAIGNGILTCENKDQAMERARPDQMDKGGDAAYAALKMVLIREQFGLNYVPADDEDLAA